MSPICLLFFVKAVLSINVASTSEPTPESQQQSSLNVRRLDDSAQSPATYNAEVSSTQDAKKESSLNVRRMDEESMHRFDESMKLEREEAFTVRRFDESLAPIKSHSESSPAEAAPTQAEAGIASSTAEATSSQDSKLNVRRLDESTQSPAENKVEPPAAEVLQPSSLNVRRTAVESSPAEANKQSSLNVRRMDDESMRKFDESMQMEREGQTAAPPKAANVEAAAPTSPAKFALKKTSKEAPSQAAVEQAPLVEASAVVPEPATPEAPLPVVSEAPRKTKAVDTNNHYRNHGANMHHVEPTPRRTSSASKPSTQQAAAQQEQAAQLAEKREEVEDIFHVSSTKVTDLAIQPEVANGIVGTLFRLVSLLGALVSIACIAYHKFEVLAQICQDQGKGRAAKFKAKHDDMEGFAEAPRLAQYTSIVETASRGLSGLSRRSRVDTMSSCEFGV